jgi:2-polyprenyl-3-methyl-5-hydroxy-6-metoxy-1,4-benzoquinol methylase
MEIHKEDELSDITRYLEKYKDVTLDDREDEFESKLRVVKKFKIIDKKTKLLELGPGIGWFLILCKQKGLSCKGLEISPQLVEHARQFGQRYGIEPDIELGNIEETDIGKSEYDVIIALSVFEHVEYWQKGIKRVFTALKPGGLLYFTSTNKFSLWSQEYHFPLYGWLPDRWRYRLRIALQGADIMKLGIDFNQFTTFRLRRFFKNLGFSRVLDLVDTFDLDTLNDPKIWKKVMLALLKRLKPLKHLALFFAPETYFICIK